MIRRYSITIIVCLVTILSCFLYHVNNEKQENKTYKVGFIYVGDASNPYTKNFIKAQEEIEEKFGDKVECVAKYNIQEGVEGQYISELIDEGCDMIFGTSYGFSASMKEAAKNHPEIQFCQATGDNANTDEVLDNYHTYMGRIYEGRYISGIVAGMKLNELIQAGEITPEEAVIGYIGAYEYAEVISGYTAFFLGVRSCCPTATMKVKYTDSWSDYTLEKKFAKELIDEGCVIISQHSDTKGPAVACEESKAKHPVFHVGYNQSMISVAPTTTLIGCRINWSAYELAAVEALVDSKEIEDVVSKKVVTNGKDSGAGFDEGWVQMLELNEIIAAEGTKEKIAETIDEFIKGKIEVYKGDYTGVNPYNSTDMYDLSNGYKENELSSAPTYSYVLRDVITIEKN